VTLCARVINHPPPEGNMVRRAGQSHAEGLTRKCAWKVRRAAARKRFVEERDRPSMAAPPTPSKPEAGPVAPPQYRRAPLVEEGKCQAIPFGYPSDTLRTPFGVDRNFPARATFSPPHQQPRAKFSYQAFLPWILVYVRAHTSWQSMDNARQQPALPCGHPLLTASHWLRL
jgi:hypothetical protein